MLSYRIAYSEDIAYMNKDEIMGPPVIWVVLTVVGGIATALGLIVTLEYASKRLSPNTHSTIRFPLTSAINSYQKSIPSLFDIPLRVLQPSD